MKCVFEKPEDLSYYLFRITDNCGRTADRYTVVFSDGSFLHMSKNPTSPQGVSMCGEGIDPQVLNEWIEQGESVDLALGDLPEHLIKHIMFRNNQGLEDFLEAVEAKDASVVAKRRSAAEVNYGVVEKPGDLCAGIYVRGGKYWVRLDGDPSEDRGPYDTAREVILASLPDQYSLAGPEFHSTEDVMRLDPSSDISDSVAQLEAKVDEAWEAERAARLGSFYG